MGNQQEKQLMNKFNIVVFFSSEIIRETPLKIKGWKYNPLYIWKYVFCIDLYINSKVGNWKNILKFSLKYFSSKNSSNNYLGSYLAGLIEGDGSIIVPRTIRNQKGKLLYPVIKITFVKKDAPLAEKIKEVIKGGQIVYYKNKGYLDLLFQDIKSIQKIAVLLNGNMRTPKIEALYRLIDWLNARSTYDLKLTKLGLDNSSLSNNAWLAGFIESDGNFYCEFKLNSEGIATLVRCYMRISQKQSYKSNISKDNSNFYIMDKIREFLEVKIVTKIQRNRANYIELAYEVRTTKKLSCEILINYLTNFPLFSSKHLDYLDWSDFHHIRISKQYKSLDVPQN